MAAHSPDVAFSPLLCARENENGQVEITGSRMEASKRADFFDLSPREQFNALAASVLGFLIWNWSPAKVFMGDAGSGFLGFTFFCFALSTENSNILPLLTWAVLVSVFAVDATLTLVTRARHRKRLSEAHRDHLYQQFIKAGYPHAAVTGAVLIGTFALSAAVWFLRPFPLLLFAGVYVALIMTWKLLYGKISAKLRSVEVTQ